MQITEVKVHPAPELPSGPEGRLKAYVSIVLSNCFIVRDLKVIRGDAGLFVAMPNRKRKDGTFKDIAHPINAETRTALEKQILQAYREACPQTFLPSQSSASKTEVA